MYIWGKKLNTLLHQTITKKSLKPYSPCVKKTTRWHIVLILKKISNFQMVEI